MPALVHSQPAYGPRSVVALMSPAGVATTTSGTSWGSGREEAILALRTRGRPSLSLRESAKDTTCAETHVCTRLCVHPACGWAVQLLHKRLLKIQVLLSRMEFAIVKHAAKE